MLLILLYLLFYLVVLCVADKERKELEKGLGFASFIFHIDGSRKSYTDIVENPQSLAC